MDVKELIFGVGLLLRERVSGWAQSSSGTSHVYPDHPPLGLSERSYPRATVDVIGNNPAEQDIEHEAEVNEPLVDVTVYATNSGDVHGKLGECHDAILTYHDDNDTSGDPYLSNWTYSRPGSVGPVIDEEADAGFTRYNKTMEFEFTGVTQTS
jgi:hypothetical protein